MRTVFIEFDVTQKPEALSARLDAFMEEHAYL
jgi:hypothetical protein